jgi:mitochondrial fission protein ELM1
MGISPRGDQLTSPWPDIIVSCGRHAVGPAIEVKRRSKGKAFIIHVQHPRVKLSLFDMIVAPAHDRLTGPNVIVSQGAVHRVTQKKLQIAAEKIRIRLKDHPAYKVKKHYVVIIGGPNKVFPMLRDEIADIADKLVSIAIKSNAGLFITASRRTGAENKAIIEEKFKNIPCEIWNGEGENPYFGYLGIADAIFVTGDSVNMVSEACVSGKAVHVIHLKAKKPSKFDLFHRAMEATGATRAFAPDPKTGLVEDWTYPAFDETQRSAKIIIEKMKKNM